MNKNNSKEYLVMKEMRVKGMMILVNEQSEYDSHSVKANLIEDIDLKY